MSAMTVPLFDLHAQHQELQEQLESAMARVVASARRSWDRKSRPSKQEAARYCGVGHAVGCASGTDALSLALQTLGVGPDDEVDHAGVHVFRDGRGGLPAGRSAHFRRYRRHDLQPRPAPGGKTRSTAKTKAILVVHLFGQCAEMEPLWHVAERHNLPHHRGRRSGLWSRISGQPHGHAGRHRLLQLLSTKILGAYGDAGMVATNDPEWAARLGCLRVHGMETRYHHKYIGWNARLDALQAAVLRVKLLTSSAGFSPRPSPTLHMLIEEHHLGHFLERPVTPSPWGERAGVRWETAPSCSSINTSSAWPRETRRLDPENGRLQGVEPGVPADVLVMITRFHAVDAETAQARGPFRIVGRYHAGVAIGAENLSRIKAEAGDGAQRARAVALIFRLQRPERRPR